jgi:hypothetical protein
VSHLIDQPDQVPRSPEEPPSVRRSSRTMSRGERVSGPVARTLKAVPDGSDLGGFSSSRLLELAVALRVALESGVARGAVNMTARRASGLTRVHSRPAAQRQKRPRMVLGVPVLAQRQKRPTPVGVCVLLG